MLYLIFVRLTGWLALPWIRRGLPVSAALGGLAWRGPPGGRGRGAGMRRDPGRRGPRRRGRLAEGGRDQRVELRVRPLLIRVHDVRERRACLAGGMGHADHLPGEPAVALPG